MSDELVKERDFEAGICVFLLPQIEPHLSQAKQVEVVDDKSRQEHDAKSTEENCPQQIPSPGRFCFPDDLISHRVPLPVEKNQYQAGDQYIGAAFHRFRNDLRPLVLEPWPCHDRVLNTK